uniref:hypothetical protein n=1 Tax=Escherichia coli TaxID=562 RepID=UPI001953F260
HRRLIHGIQRGSIQLRNRLDLLLWIDLVHARQDASNGQSVTMKSRVLSEVLSAVYHVVEYKDYLLREIFS